MNEKNTTFLLSLISGFTDTAGFIALGGLFTAHVTGNFVLAGASLVRSETAGVVPKLVMFPVFALIVSATFLISRRLESNGRNAILILLVLEAVFLFAFAVVGSFFQSGIKVTMTETAITITGALGVTAMAIQNALMRQHLKKFPQTTVMTGNVTQFAIDLTKRFLLPKTDERNETNESLIKIGTAIAGFLCGAICGALAVSNFGLLAILLPCALTLLAAFGARTKSLQKS